MAFSATGQSGALHYLVEILLDSTTLRYSDEGMSVRLGSMTGAYYEGRLPRAGGISRTLGTFLEPRETVDVVDVRIDNSDGSLATLIDNATFANRTVRVWLGEGDNRDDYSRIFTGNVAHPGGLGWDQDEATVTVIDARVKDRRILPPPEQKYSRDTYPNLQDSGRATPIPIVYGNWSSAAASGAAVPCTCVNRITNKFKVAGHGLQSIDRYLKNAVALDSSSEIRNVSLSDASFELTGAAYNATSDIIAINCKGLETANGTLVENPSLVLRNILTSYLGLTGTDLNVTSFSALTGDTEGVSMRRVINSEASSDTLIVELCNEAMVDLRFQDGKYSPKYRELNLDADRTNFHEWDIVLRDEHSAEFRVAYDEERYYTNEIASRYQYSPLDVQFLSATTVNDVVAIVRDRSTVQRQMDFRWMWDKDQTERRVERELFLFSKKLYNVELELTRRALLKDLGDQIDLTYSIFSDKAFQVRGIETDLDTMTTRLHVYDLFTDAWGAWTSDAANSFTAASYDEWRSQGFWTTDGGLCESGNYNSKYSYWYG